MKAMILAAGLGTRMRPLTDHCPKPLLKAGGKPLIDFHLEKLAAAGFDEVVVNCSWLADQLLAYLDNGDRYGLRLTLSREDKPLETAGGIIKALDHLGDEPFLLVNGDIWTDYDFSKLYGFQTEGAHLVLIDNPPHHPSGDFNLSGAGQVNESGEGPRYTYAGLSVWHPRCFAGFSQGRRALKPLMQQTMALGRLSGERFGGHWWDIGTPERLAALDLFLRSAGLDS